MFQDIESIRGSLPSYESDFRRGIRNIEHIVSLREDNLIDPHTARQLMRDAVQMIINDAETLTSVLMGNTQDWEGRRFGSLLAEVGD